MLLAFALLALLRPVAAQCDFPPELRCQPTVAITLRADCTAPLALSQLLINSPDCLQEADYTIRVEDGFTLNGAVIDGAGEHDYLITGNGNSGAAGYNCRGRIVAFDLSAPAVESPDGVSFVFGCHQREELTLNADARPCFSLSADGTVVGADPELIVRLGRGGGLPAISERCGAATEVCVSDRRRPGGPTTGCTDTTSVERRFTVTDQSGNTVTLSHTLHFVRPELSSLTVAENSYFDACPDGSAAPERPAPRPVDYPYFTTPRGPVHLTASACEQTVSYTDGALLPDCGENYGFVRNYRIVDWCRAGAERTFAQFVQIGDRTGPSLTLPTQDLDFDGRPDGGPLVFGTNVGCDAIVNLRGNAIIADNCSATTELLAYVFPYADETRPPLGPYRIFGAALTEALSDPLPIGDHLVRYVGSDPCGNETGRDLSLRIVDTNVPTALCSAGVRVALDREGNATLTAAAVDGGSHAACGTVSLAITRAGSFPPAFGPTLELDCADLGGVGVLLEAVDTSGRDQRCATTVVVTDEIPPNCTAPPDATITCLEFRERFPFDLAADPARAATLLDANFGTGTGTDNCGTTSTASRVVADLNSCGSGTLLRTFTTTDGGNVAGPSSCSQSVTVSAVHDYRVTFPADARVECAPTSASAGPVITGAGCELFTVSASTDTLGANASACYQLRVIYEVINWCEYTPGNGPLRLREYRPNGAGTTLEVGERGATLDGTTEIDDYASGSRRGFFRYAQYVIVEDNQPPRLEIGATEGGVAFTADCLGGIIFNLLAVDNCAGPTLALDLDLDPADLNGDGAVDAADFREELPISVERLRRTTDSTLALSVPNLPIGRHLARFVATDVCGNTTAAVKSFEIVDVRPPTPLCIGQVSVRLAVDPDLGGIGTLPFDALVAGPTQVCSPAEIRYALYSESEALVEGFLPSPGTDQITFTCSDVGNRVVRLYAFTPNGQFDYCQSTVTVRPSQEGQCQAFQGIIAGTILTESGLPVPGVTVTNIYGIDRVQETDPTGNFLFDALREGQDYTIQPYLDRDHINGVSTLDILLIGRYLLGRGEPWTPYQYIAADANRSRAVTIRDLIHIRDVLLDLDSDFDNNTSWRFVPEEYVFPDPNDPWFERFPEVSNRNNLSGYERSDFVAVKVGDVSGNVVPLRAGNGPEGAGTSLGAPDRIVLELRALTDGSGRHGLFLPAEAEVAGLQLTLGSAHAKQLAEIRTDRATGGYSRQLGRRLHLSLAPVAVGRPDLLDPSLPLLTLPSELARSLTLETGAGTLPAEVYTNELAVVSPEIRYVDQPSSGPAELRVYPNPLGDRGTLRADWPATETGELNIYSAAGRLLARRSVPLRRGTNEIALGSADFGGAAGAVLITVSGVTGGTKTVRVLRRR